MMRSTARPLRRAAAALCALAASFAAPAAAQDMVRFDRDQAGQVVLSVRQSAGGQAPYRLEAAIGAYRNELVSRYSPNVGFRKMGRAVGRLDVFTDTGVFPCTAFLISDRYALTNWHCVPGITELTDSTRVESAILILGHVTEGLSEGAQRFTVNPVPIEQDEALDYAIMEVFGQPSRDWGTLKLASAQIESGRPFWIIGHPLGGAQRISREDCASAAPAIDTARIRLRHTCDTMPGNSGSPVIDTDTREVVALHHAGASRDQINFAVPMADIIAASAVLQGLTQPGTPVATAPARPATPPPATPVAAVPGAGDPCAGAEAHFAMAERIGTVEVLESHLQFYGTCAYAAAVRGILGSPGRRVPAEEPPTEPPVARTPTFPQEEEPEDRTAGMDDAIARCDRLAASPYDSQRAAGVPGVLGGDMDSRAALAACRQAVRLSDEPRLRFQLARALDVRGDQDRAFEAYEELADEGYAAAQAELGFLYESGTGVDADLFQAALLYRRAADGGDMLGQYNLGILYETGEGVRQSDTRAVRFYRAAAEQGMALAQTNLGWMTEMGRGTEQDMAEAARWYLAAAEQGEPIAQGNIGWFYQNGTGVAQDDGEALRWYQAAADQGDARGQLNLGWMYDEGRGTAENDTEAARWYRASAEQGDAIAQGNLGYMYENGFGVRQDYEEAARWYGIAADQGDPRGQSNLAYLTENGLGVDRNRDEAVRLYRLAAAQDWEDAIRALERLGAR